MLAPRREQLTGDEAHERVRAMLAETVDNDLWHAQRVLQSASTAAVDLSGCDALSRALDVAAGDSGGGCAAPSLYSSSGSTPSTGVTSRRPDGRRASGPPRSPGWPTPRPRSPSARRRSPRSMTGCARHAVLTEQVAELVATPDRCRAAACRRAGSRRQNRGADRAAREAKLVAEAAAATAAAANAAHTGRLRLLAEIETRGRRSRRDANAGRRKPRKPKPRPGAEAEAAGAALQQATEALAELQRRTESARCAVDQLANREEADRLTARLAKIDTIQRDRERIGAELSTIAVTEAVLRRIEDAAAAVDRTGGQLALTSAAIEFSAAADINWSSAVEQMSLPAGQSWSITAAGPTAVEVPGVLTARVTPGATTLDIHAKHAAAQEELAAALAAGEVTDLAAARSADQRRRELHSSP